LQCISYCQREGYDILVDKRATRNDTLDTSDMPDGVVDAGLKDDVPLERREE
jgi:hypothetical protein